MSGLDDMETGWTSGGWLEDTPMSGEPLPPPTPSPAFAMPARPAAPTPSPFREPMAKPARPRRTAAKKTAKKKAVKKA